MRSFHFDRGTVQNIFHTTPGARHRIRANSTIVFYGPFKHPVQAFLFFFHQPLIFLHDSTTSFRWSWVLGRYAVPVTRDKRRSEIYGGPVVFFSAYIGHRRRGIIICRGNENERRFVLLSIFHRDRGNRLPGLPKPRLEDSRLKEFNTSFLN